MTAHAWQAHEAHATSCPNCEETLPSPPGRHCASCGQETHLHAPTAFEFVHEFVAHYIALEGSLWRTLWSLVARPGQLTLEYLAGRRRRYVLPLRLYLTLSIVFFFALKLSGPGVSGGIEAPATTGMSGSVEERRNLMEICPFGTVRCERGIKRLQELSRPGDSGMSGMGAAWLSKAPYVALGLVPVLAMWMQLFHRKRRMNYGVHMVAALHLQSTWFLWMLAGMALPAGFDGLPFYAALVASVVLLRRVYGGRWWTAALRTLTLAFIYGACLVLATAIFFLATLFL